MKRRVAGRNHVRQHRGSAEYLALLLEVVEDARRELEQETAEATAAGAERRRQAIQLATYKLTQLKGHLATSHRLPERPAHAPPAALRRARSGGGDRPRCSRRSGGAPGRASDGAPKPVARRPSAPGPSRSESSAPRRARAQAAGAERQAEPDHHELDQRDGRPRPRLQERDAEHGSRSSARAVRHRAPPTRPTCRPGDRGPMVMASNSAREAGRVGAGGGPRRAQRSGDIRSARRQLPARVTGPIWSCPDP